MKRIKKATHKNEGRLLNLALTRPPRPLGEGAGGEGITPRGLEVERSVAHAARGGDGGHEGR